MANDTELERKQLQVFCGGAGEQQTSVFGTMKNPDPDYSKDPETLQGTNWPQGWQNAIAADDAPFMEDMNSLFYVLSYMVKYLYQHGIPEWNNKETYTASKSVVLRNGKFYLAKQTTGADNPQDPATDASFTYWYLALDPVNPAADQNWVKGYAQSLANLSQTIDGSTSKYPSNKAVQTALGNIDLTGYAKTDLSNVSENIDYVIEIGGNQLQWYRKYKSGWIEQGGLRQMPNEPVTINLMKPYINTDFNIVISPNSNVNSWPIAYISSKASTAFTMDGTGNYQTSARTIYFSWFACGQGAE